MVSKYISEKENYPEYEENENKLNRSEEDGNYFFVNKIRYWKYLYATKSWY